MRTISVFQNPLAAEQGDRVFGTVVNSHEIDKRMRLFHGQTDTTVMVSNFIKRSGQTGYFVGTASHKTKLTHNPFASKHTLRRTKLTFGLAAHRRPAQKTQHG
jgi:hypothetical protein